MKLQVFMSQLGGVVNSVVFKFMNFCQVKCLILLNIFVLVIDDSIVNFFNLQFNGLNVIEQMDLCFFCNIFLDWLFVMFEFCNNIDVMVVLVFDGIMMDVDDYQVNGNGVVVIGLKICWLKDYIVFVIVEDFNYDFDFSVLLINVVDGLNKISVINIFFYFIEDQVMEFFVSFGKFKLFVFVKDNGI